MSMLKEFENDETVENWKYMVCDFFDCYDREKGCFIHLPFSGGYYEQDDFIWVIWQYIRSIYYDLMSSEVFLQELENRKKYLTKSKG